MRWSRLDQRHGLLGVPCKVVEAAGEGVVGHGVETYVQLVAAEPEFEVCGLPAAGLPVLVEFGANVDAPPGGKPGPPIEEPGRVVEPVTICRVAPVEDAADAGSV